MSSFPQFLGGAFNGRSPSFDASRLVNFYVEASESGTSRSPLMLVGCPGLNLWLNLAGGRTRGSIVFDTGMAIVVTGTNVWKVTSAKVATLLGTVPDSSPVVSMASNGIVVMMVDGPNGYFIDPTAGVTPIVNENFTGANRVDFLDGRFVWNDPDTGKFQYSDLYSENIDGLSFEVAEGSPDDIVSLIVDHRELWLLGQDSSEVWIDTGDLDAPIQRIQGAFLEIGCAAAMSVAKADNSIFWLATDNRGFGTVQRAVGYAPQRVSNHAVEYAIGQYQKNGGIADAIGYTYSQEGHIFYVLTFPAAGATWCLDLSNNLWHERLWRDPATGALGRHRSNCQMNFAGLTIVGDWENGNLYSLDLDTHTDNGALILGLRVCPHVTNDANYVLHHALELTMQTGVGLETGEDPQLRIRWSDDGGYNWSNEHWVSIGKIGATKSRARIRRLGVSRDRVYEMAITDPIKRIVTGAELETSPCAV